jgi:hypothetical protein
VRQGPCRPSSWRRPGRALGVSLRQDLSAVSCIEQSGFLRSTFDRAGRHIDLRVGKQGQFFQLWQRFRALGLLGRRPSLSIGPCNPSNDPSSCRCHCPGEIFLHHGRNHFSIHSAASIDSPTYRRKPWHWSIHLKTQRLVPGVACHRRWVTNCCYPQEMEVVVTAVLCIIGHQFPFQPVRSEKCQWRNFKRKCRTSRRARA